MLQAFTVCHVLSEQKHHPPSLHVDKASQQTVRAFQRRTARAAMSLSQKWIIMDNFNGGFLKWGYPNSWMVYKGRSQNKIDDVEVLAFEETSRSWNTKIQSSARSVAVGSFSCLAISLQAGYLV